jgi:hypothetical protein
MISPDWFDDVWGDGLVKGESRYYVAKKDGKQAIFDKDGNQISPWYDWIEKDGLIRGLSKYYIAQKDKKWAIFDIDGNQISDWFDYIYPYGLVRGESDYYMAWSREGCAVYYKDGQKVSDYFPEEYLRISEKIVFNENLGIVEIKDGNGQTRKSIDFNPVYPFKEEIIDYTKLLNI